MPMSFHQNNRTERSADPPGWILVQGAFALILLLIGLPALLIGFLAQRFTQRYGWSFLLWFVLLIPSAFFSYALYRHGLQLLLMKELTDYLLAIKHYQTNFARWDLKALWSLTWPVWVQTLVAFPIVGFWLEVSQNARGGNTTRFLEQQERRREHSLRHAQRRARKRAAQPDGLPDAVCGMLVMGVPIDDTEQE